LFTILSSIFNSGRIHLVADLCSFPFYDFLLASVHSFLIVTIAISLNNTDIRAAVKLFTVVTFVHPASFCDAGMGGCPGVDVG
jgi:hypothetical protein